MKLARIVSAALLFSVALVAARQICAGFPIPGIPGVPGADPQTIAINAAARQMAPFVAAKVPIILDWNAVYPTVTTLPGRPFAPVTGTVAMSRRTELQSQLARSSTGIAHLPPGDYALQVRVYCTDIHRHAGHRALWILGPLRGARATVLAALYARASGKNIPFGDLQSLSWAIQAGMRYDELNPAQRGLVDRLIGDMRVQIAGSFLDQAQGQWNSLSSTIPGLPSMDSALGRLGDAGQTILNVKYARDTILADASNFDAMSRALAPPGGSASDENSGEPPWSIVTAQVYERLVTPGHFGSASELEIRVLPGAATVSVPFTDVIGYPPNHKDWQPLTQESPLFVFGVKLPGELE